MPASTSAGSYVIACDNPWGQAPAFPAPVKGKTYKRVLDPSHAAAFPTRATADKAADDVYALDRKYYSVVPLAAAKEQFRELSISGMPLGEYKARNLGDPVYLPFRAGTDAENKQQILRWFLEYFDPNGTVKMETYREWSSLVYKHFKALRFDGVVLETGQCGARLTFDHRESSPENAAAEAALALPRMKPLRTTKGLPVQGRHFGVMTDDLSASGVPYIIVADDGTASACKCAHGRDRVLKTYPGLSELVKGQWEAWAYNRPGMEID